MNRTAFVKEHRIKTRPHRAVILAVFVVCIALTTTSFHSPAEVIGVDPGSCRDCQMTGYVKDCQAIDEQTVVGQPSGDCQTGQSILETRDLNGDGIFSSDERFTCIITSYFDCESGSGAVIDRGQISQAILQGCGMVTAGCPGG